MKKTLLPRLAPIAIVFLLQLLGLETSLSQSRISSSIEYLRGNVTNGTGRDYWFTMAQNYESQGGKYYELFVTSPQATTVNIQISGGSTSKYPITAGQVLNFIIPLAWELTTSGVIEDKGIHVWSNDADLIVNLLSRNPGSSDGMLIIPTTGWGTEYVVGAYGSFYDGYTLGSDLPSEFCIVANQDNTICTITPNCDIRMSNGKPVHKAYIPFTEILARGQCVQYKAVQATNADDFDLTGSIITSNNSIGVIGASQCPYIPAEFPYCDHICDMIAPVRTWGKTYQTIPFAQRFGGDTYLVIASKPGQIIHRNGQQYFISSKKYEYYFRPDISDASQWTSDAPFMLAQYINGSTWPDINGPKNVGDPAMVVINSVEQYTSHIIFQTPNITNGNGFQNFVNVMVNNNAKNRTTFDGQPIASFKGTTQMPIPGSNYIAFTVASLSPGKHEVVSDSGVGMYLYGYASYDSYAWSGNLGIATLNDPDTIPPVAKASGDCFDALVTVTDNHKTPLDSKISTMKIDSIYNMEYNPDPNYEEGIAADSTFYMMHVIDRTKEAYLQIRTYDYAGNRTLITSTYQPQLVSFSPSTQDYGIVKVGTKSCKYISIQNNGNISDSVKNLKLLAGNNGFVIDSGITNNTIPVGGFFLLLVCFTPKTPNFAADTLVLSDGCPLTSALLIGSGGTPFFTLSNNDFKCTDIGTTKTDTATIVANPSPYKITIDSIWIDDQLHFAYNGIPTLPITIDSAANLAFVFSFIPDKSGNYKTIVHFHSKEAGEQTAQLSGCGQIPASVGSNIYSSSLSKESAEYSAISAKLNHGDDVAMLPPMPNPLMHGESTIRFIYGLKLDSPIDLSIYDILGNSVATVIHQGHQSAGIYEVAFPVSANMPSGNYIYRLFGAGKVISGKLVVVK